MKRRVRKKAILFLYFFLYYYYFFPIKSFLLSSPGMQKACNFCYSLWYVGLNIYSTIARETYASHVSGDDQLFQMVTVPCKNISSFIVWSLSTLFPMILIYKMFTTRSIYMVRLLIMWKRYLIRWKIWPCKKRYFILVCVNTKRYW